MCNLHSQGCGQVTSQHVIYRNTVVENIQNKHAVVSLVAENLTVYMNRVREIQKGAVFEFFEMYDLRIDKKPMMMRKN